MNSDPASLQNLRDIAVPPPVPWWPLAPGWWVLLGLLILVGALVGFRSWRVWRASAYRRAAVRELQSATTVEEIAAILKRTALVAFPRTEIAALSGSAWCRWLGDRGGMAVPDPVADALTSGVFDRSGPEEVHQLRGFAASWIERHGLQTQGHQPQTGA